MRLRLTALAMAGACGMALAAGQARADVIYDFIQTSAQGGDPMAPSYPFTGIPGGIRLDVTNAAVASGGLMGSIPACGPGSVICASLVPGLVSITDYDYGALNLNLTFAQDGTLAGTITVQGSGEGYMLSGSGMSWTGTLLGTDRQPLGFACDLSQGGSIPLCTFAGYFAGPGFAPASPVPEPASFALLGMGVLGLGLVRGRKRTAI